MKLYLIRIIDSYMMSEKKDIVMTYIPDDTLYYKYEVLSEIDIKIPEHISYNEELRTFEDDKYFYSLFSTMNYDGSLKIILNHPVTDECLILIDKWYY